MNELKCRFVGVDWAARWAGSLPMEARAWSRWPHGGTSRELGQACTKAEIPDDLAFHDIRSSAVTSLVEVGPTSMPGIARSAPYRR
jgi:hypothetical protein